jgi:hypothetical protein
MLLEAATPQQRKALMRLLVKEIRVMSREEIWPTYKLPGLVRAPQGHVVLTDRCANRPILAALPLALAR